MSDIDTTNAPAPSPAVTITKPKAKTALPAGVKFQRDQGNFNPDGSIHFRNFDDTWTEDICPKSPVDDKGIPAHDLARIQPGQINGKKAVECAYCHTLFASKEDYEPPVKK